MIVCLHLGEAGRIQFRAGPVGVIIVAPGILFTEGRSTPPPRTTSTSLLSSTDLYAGTRRCSTVFSEDFQAVDLESASQEITIVARDRGGGYGEAAAKALPHATVVADRWHRMDNVSRAFLDAAQAHNKSDRDRCHHSRSSVAYARRTHATRGYLSREETNAVILALAREPDRLMIERQAEDGGQRQRQRTHQNASLTWADHSLVEWQALQSRGRMGRRPEQATH